MEAADARNLERFRRQYFQLLDLHELAWPSRTILRSANAQAWLYANLFSSEATKYLPPTRYQLRVLKTLLKSIEDSIEDPEEDEISDDLSSTLASLMTEQQPSEAVAAQLPSYVTYIYPSQAEGTPEITILESRAVIASAGTTGRRTWEAALHLSQYLWQHGESMIRGKKVLELGAGTGLVSVLCARWLGADHVTATDGDDGVVEDIRGNLFLNGLEGMNAIYAKSLKWGQNMDENEAGQPPFYNVVLGADVTFDTRIMPSLIATLRDVAALNEEVEIIVAATIRNAKTFSTFVKGCEDSGFSLTDIDYPVKPSELQEGPFYSATTPIRIIKIEATQPAEDPFAI